MSAEVIKGNGKLIPEVVKLWVEHFDKDPKHATVEFLMMLFEVNLHYVSNLPPKEFLSIFVLKAVFEIVHQWADLTLLMHV